MKKALSYATIAILLGTVTMLAPRMLIQLAALPDSDDKKYVPTGLLEMPRYCPQSEESLEGVIVNATALDRAEAFGRTLCPSNLSSAGLMLIPSFLLALGVSLYFRKRMF